MDAEESGRALRRLLGGVPHAALALERRTGQRPVQVHRRRQDVDRVDEEPRPADRRCGARSASRSRARIRTASTRSSKRPRAACSCRTTRARPGSWSTTTGVFASARSTTRASTPTRRSKDTVYVLNTGFYRSTDAGKTHSRHPRAARRQPRSVDRAERREADDQQQRRRRQRLGQCRRELDGSGLSDRAVLQRLHDRARALSRVRRAAGQQHGLPAVRLGGELYPVGGGESGYIAPDPQDTDVFYAGSYGGLLTRINRRTGERRNINVWPDNPMGHSSSDITERFQWTFPIVVAPTDPDDALRHLAARLEVDERRPELAADQPRPHASRSVDAWAHRADRSRSIRPASRPTPRCSRSRRRPSTAT